MGKRDALYTSACFLVLDHTVTSMLHAFAAAAAKLRHTYSARLSKLAHESEHLDFPLTVT